MTALKEDLGKITKINFGTSEMDWQSNLATSPNSFFEKNEGSYDFETESSLSQDFDSNDPTFRTPLRGDTLKWQKILFFSLCKRALSRED